MTILPGFYEADRLEQVAINLFYGWGYNFYRLENQLRTDDQLVRAQAGALLGAARRSVELAEADWRRTRLPPPTRAKPRPDPEAVAGAQQLERLAAGIGALAGQVQSQPVPENDRMTQRFRDEADTLAKLIAVDQRLVGQAELLRAALDRQPGGWIVEHAVELDGALAGLGQTLSERQVVLLVGGGAPH